MRSHLPPEDDQFEAFRREKRKRFQENREPQVAPGLGGSARALAEDEHRSALELRLQREMQEFVESTTRLAAQILSEVSEEHSRQVEERISREMKEFFRATLQRCEDLVQTLRREYGVKNQDAAEIEAHLKELACEALDSFRFEGSQQAAQRHLGQRPGEVRAQDPAAKIGEDAAKPQEPTGDTPPAEAEARDRPLVPPSSEGGDHGAETGSLETLATVFDDAADAAGGEGPSWRARSGLHAPVDFSGETAGGPAAAGTAGAGRESGAAGAEPAHEPQDAQASSGDAAGAAHALLASLTGDLEKLRKALTLMVAEGILEREEARRIYRQARARN